MIKLCEKIPEKMKKKGGLNVDVVANEPSDQADWFYSFLAETKSS